MYIALSYKHILYMEVAYINCLAGSLSTFVGKTPVPNFSALFSH
jgi:hypothetical protein